MTKTALIVWGGWEGHEPQKVAEVFRGVLVEQGLDVMVSDTLEVFESHDLTRLSLIVPIWTMGEITNEQLTPVIDAVEQHGVGLAGCHGGMCDAFRKAERWHFMTGGQWVAHPGNDGVKYTINIGPVEHEITAGMSNFEVSSEQYYLHVDPAVQVLATCTFPTPGVDGPHVPNGTFEMPQVWTKRFGQGKVFYNALGHNAKVFDIPESLELMRRGFAWATK